MESLDTIRQEPMQWLEPQPLPMQEPLSISRPDQHIVLIGGGGGNSALAPGYIDALPDSRFTIVTGIADSGSATGLLRERYGGGAVGDLSKVVAAVSGNVAGAYMNTRLSAKSRPETVRDQLYDMESVMRADDRTRSRAIMEATVCIAEDLHHNEAGGLAGHRIGNLLLTALRLDHNGDIALATQEASEWLETRATVLPSSTDPHDLMMSHNGKIERGEGRIDSLDITHPESAVVWVAPTDTAHKVSIHEAVRQAIAGADKVILQPGSHWTSLRAQLAIPGMVRAIQEQRHTGQLVAVANLTVDRDTRGFKGTESIQALGRAAGRPIDAVIYNTAPLPPHTADGQPVTPQRFEAQELRELNIQPIAAPLVGRLTVREAEDPIAHLRRDFNTDAAAVVAAMASHQMLQRSAVAS